jgi:hypothetical protein
MTPRRPRLTLALSVLGLALFLLVGLLGVGFVHVNAGPLEDNTTAFTGAWGSAGQPRRGPTPFVFTPGLPGGSFTVGCGSALGVLLRHNPQFPSDNEPVRRLAAYECQVRTSKRVPLLLLGVLILGLGVGRALTAGESARTERVASPS